MTAVRLRVLATAAKEMRGQEILIPGKSVWIGRGDDCDVVVKDFSISRRHAQVELAEGGAVTVRDNKSANGTLVDGKRVEEARIEPGGRFTLGGTMFELLAEDDPTASKGPDSRTMMVPRIADLVKELERPRTFDEHGELIVTRANRPFLAADPASMWVVESGKVEIFTIAVENGQPTGQRTHFLTVEPGQGFFGIDSDGFGFDSGFLAVGKAGSQLRRYALEDLQLLALTPAHRERIAGMVSTWVEGLSRRLTEDLTGVPATQIDLRLGEETELEPGKVATPAGGVVWLEMPSANFLFDGMASFSYEVEGVLFPLAPGSWIELLMSDREVTFKPRATADSVRDARLWPGLDAFHRVLCECEFLNKKLAAVDEMIRLEKKAEHVEKAQEAAMGAIGAVLGGARSWVGPAPGGIEIAPLVTAAKLVGELQGIDVQAHPHGKPDTTFEDALADIATASRFRIRRVKLGDEWWKHDGGALLGQREEGGAPVALLPSGASAYVCADPASGERVKVTDDLALSLSGFGYCFYTPLPSGTVSLRGLLRFAFRGLGSDFRAVAMMGVGVGLLSTVTPMITGKVFDAAIPQAERDTLLQFCSGLFIVALATAAFQITQKIAMLRVQGKMDYSVQAAVWDRLIDLPMGFFRDYAAGDLADRAAGVGKIRMIIAGAGVGAILGSVASLFNAIQMAVYSFTLAGVGALLALTYVGLTFGANYIQLRFQRKELTLTGRIHGLVLQLISGVSKLRVSGAENHAFRVWATQFADQRRVSFIVGRVGNFIAVLNAGFTIVASLVIFATMVYLKKKAAESGEAFDLTTGDFLAFNAAFGIFLAAMQALGDASVGLLKVVPTFERMEPILSAEPEVDETKAAPGTLKGEIEISRVQFRYTEDGPWILKDVSIKIKPGEFVGVVGGSGSGKSTLMRLMLGFEKAEIGRVYFDGQDLATLDLRMVRQQLGVVLQDSRVLPAEIYRNIVGATSATVQDAWNAARQAGLERDIKMMPMGMHTYVTEGGGGLSGGQKQRLMIARAIVGEPKILFLDEATSALDNQAQATVTESMDRLHATRIVIAHRLSTIENADCIYYLDEGTVAESGTYEELMAKDGLFAQLAKRQLV